MALQISVVPTAPRNQTSNGKRPIADYYPTIWGDYFLSHISDSKTMSTSICQQHEVLKEEVRKMLKDSMAMAPSQRLQLIDAVQRLGVAYHFKKEIEGALEEISSEGYDGGDLYTASLWFRLLRQQGFHVSCEIFKKFKDNEGHFKESLIDDVQGMLGLYEAGHLGIHGEDILEEAIEFTSTNLQSKLANLTPELVEQVRHALTRPIRKWLPRLNARHYIASCSEDGSHNKILLKFAKFDFNIVQKVHQEELHIITRWDIKAADVLPENMKRVYDIVLDVFKELEHNMEKQGMLYAVEYTKEALKKLVQCYMAEVRWREVGYVPSMEEYLDIALVTAAYLMLSTASFVGMGPLIATKEAFEWVSSFPKIVRAASIVCRFMDDIVSREFEQERDHAASAAECYMKQYGVSEEDAIKFFRQEIAYAWKDINEECLAPTPISMALLERVLNLARAMDIIYKEIDGYTNSHILKDCIASLLKDPLPL